jgi:hypothetical protein
MDPTPDQLRNVDSLDSLFALSGLVDPGLRLVVTEGLGGPTTVRELSYVTPSDLEDVLSIVRIDRPPLVAGQGTPLTPIQKGLVRYTHRLARLRAGLPVETAATLPERNTAPAAVTFSPPTKKVKLSSLVDSSAEADLVNLEGAEVRRMFSDYKSTRGDFPHQDMEPSEEQLSAVAQLLQTGQSPYVDFSLFGPHGKRALRKLSLVSFAFQADTGGWKRVELPGPPDFATWWRAWLVLKTTLLLLQAVASERLDHYGEHIRRLVDLYGPDAWFIVYQADVRFRSEELERLRRSAQIGYETQSPEDRARTGFNPDLPWDWAFGAGISDVGRAFWDTEVHRPAVLFLARLKTRPETTTDGTTVLSGQAVPTPASEARGHNSPKSQKGKKKRGKGASPKAAPAKASGPARDNRDKGTEICNNYLRGNCRDPCPFGRIHQSSSSGGHGGGSKGKPAPKKEGTGGEK